MSPANDSVVPRPARPCTEYNIFFQLERAHVLQVQIGAEPSLDGLEAFRPEQPTYSGMPPLPARYASLVLPYDWHLPGKEKRRKRKHRKSHGLIAFHDLSNNIAAAWKVVDEDIKLYCSTVSEAGVERYKAELRAWKQSGGPEKEQQKKNAAKIVKEKSTKDKAKTKKASKAAVRAAAPVREKPKKMEIGRLQEPKKTLTVSEEMDFDLEALLNDIQFDGDETRSVPVQENVAPLSQPSLQFNVEPTPIAVGSVLTPEDEKPLIDQFFAAGVDLISSIHPDESAPVTNNSTVFGLTQEGFVNGAAQRNSSIVSNEPVDMDDNEILGMWNGDPSQVEAKVVDNSQYFVVPAQPVNAPALNHVSDIAKDDASRKSAFGIKGHDMTMEEVLHLRKVLQMQTAIMEKVQRPAVRHRRRSVTACCA